METIKNFFNRVDAKLLIIEFMGLITCCASFFHLIIRGFNVTPINYGAMAVVILATIFLWLVEFRKVHFVEVVEDITVVVDEDKTEE